MSCPHNPPHSTAYTGFFQPRPTLPNPFTDDPLLHRILRRHIGNHLFGNLAPVFAVLATEAISPRILGYGDDTNRNLPSVTHWDGWGNRVDVLHTSEGWRKLKEFWARSGLMQDFYSRSYGPASRIVGWTKYYLIAPSIGGTMCPLAMTDGAARCLELHASKDIQDKSIPRLTACDAEQLWTAGQWMTERAGGSDVRGTETYAYPEPDGTYTIKGFKWFSSATDSDIALLLAKTPTNENLSLFWIRVKHDDGHLNGVRIIRLKDKFGTKTIPTAELELTGVRGALIVGREGEGVKCISEVLNITRLHCAMGTVCSMRNGFNIVKDYARKRKVFGKFLMDNALHVRTMTNLAIQLRCVTHFTFLVVTLMGKTEVPSAKDEDAPLLLRLFTPVLKAVTAKTGVAFLSECMECLGGQGYVEEGGIAVLYRDTQVHSIWEGTTNVLAEDMLRVLRGRSGVATLDALDRYIAASVREGEKCAKFGEWPRRFGDVYAKWRTRVTEYPKEIVTANARELIISLGWTIGAMEMMVDAATDGDDIEIECCKRVFNVKNQGWDADAHNTFEWDRKIVFGRDFVSSSSVEARL